MRLAVLLSGGKDSLYSCWKAMQTDEVVCFITIRSVNTESYMFHTPNIDLTRLQAGVLQVSPLSSGKPMVRKR